MNPFTPVKPITSFLGILLLIIHGFLALWAVAGLAEMASPHVPWNRITNPLFPGGLLLAHWISVLVASTAFVAGYALRWSRMPVVMLFSYGAMAAVCAVETFGYLVHPTRFLDMSMEYATYLLILAFLFHSDAMKKRFSQSS